MIYVLHSCGGDLTFQTSLYTDPVCMYVSTVNTLQMHIRMYVWECTKHCMYSKYTAKQDQLTTACCELKPLHNLEMYGMMHTHSTQVGKEYIRTYVH